MQKSVSFFVRKRFAVYKFLSFAAASIFGNLTENMTVHRVAAVKSAHDSARNTPSTPNQCGSISANGISSMTFLSSAINNDVFACPSATNMF